MNENLRPHLKISEHKSIEDRTYESGGGGGTYPRNDYARHSKKLFKEAQVLKAIFAKQKDKELTQRRYFRVQFPKEKNMWTSDGQKLSQNIQGSLVGTESKQIGHFSTLDRSFNTLVDQLETYKNTDTHVGKSKFAPINKISDIPREEKISKGLASLIKNRQFDGEALVSLFSDLTNEEQQVLKRAIDEYLSSRDGSVLSDVETDFGRVLRIKAKAEDIDGLVDSFLCIQTVDPVDEVFVESSRPGARIEDGVSVLPNSSDAKVCIFDSGVVAGSRFLDSSILDREEPIGPPHDVDHGSFVASRIIFGNSLRDEIAKGVLTPQVKVLSVCMKSFDEIGNPKPARGDEFLKILRDTVTRWHREIRVYNLSMNLVRRKDVASVVTDDHVGAIAAEIDKLSKRFKVLFVLTTGNFPISGTAPKPTEPYPKYFKNEGNRMCNPGEAMLALTVGSVADRENDGSMAKVDCPSPFTRRGPGFNSYRKPDLVAQGGNLASNWRDFDDLSVAGIGKEGDRISYGNGTSYSAPIVSALGARIFEKIPNCTPELVRALLIHTCDIPGIKGIGTKMMLRLVGNGIPDPEFLLASDRWNQNYVYQGTIGYRKIVRLPFNVPSCLTSRRGNDKLGIRYTVAFSPETNRALKTGYCKSHLRTKLSKRATEEELRAVAAGGGSEFLKDRYSTVIRFNKVFSRNVANGEWELLVEQESRWTLSDPETPFAVVLTVSDPRKDASIDVFNAIQVEVPNRYEALIPVQERLRV